MYTEMQLADLVAVQLYINNYFYFVYKLKLSNFKAASRPQCCHLSTGEYFYTSVPH